MIHLMIDNCSLLHFVKTTGFNDYLLQLETLVKNRNIILYVNESILEEWNKHKEKEIKRKEKSLSIQNEITTTTLVQSSSVVTNNYLVDQTRLLDELINNHSVLIPTYDGIKQEAVERMEKKLAPFHKKDQNALNDWKIIGSYANYCEIYGINELYFVSHNINEFADDKNCNRTIHKDIQDRFTKVEINYFKNYSDFFREIDTLLGKPIIKNYISSKKFSFNSTRQKTDLESVYYLFNDLYKELNFIPINILRKYYPFAHSEDFKASYNSFELGNVQKSLMNYLNNIRIIDGCKIEKKEDSEIDFSQDVVSKLNFILKKFNANLIYNISGYQSRTSIDIKFTDSQDVCECCKCLYESFNFKETYNKLAISKKEIDLSERMKNAYYKYKLGQTLLAFSDFKKISEEALNCNLYITYFISQYNLIHIGRILYFDFDYDQKECEKLSSEASKIDLFDIAYNFKSLTDYELVLYIARQNFFHEGYEQINSITEKIIENKRHYENGGWSSNSYVNEIMQEFGEVEFFIRSNYVIFDEYSDFDALFDNVIKSFLASYATSDKSGGRFSGFNSYWLHKFIIYSTPKGLKKQFTQNQIKNIKYFPDKNEIDFFLEFAKNLLKSENCEFVNSEYSNRRFRDKYDKYCQNIVILASYLDLKSEVLDSFATLLIDNLQSQNKENYDLQDAVEIFIIMKGKNLTSKNKNRFLNHYLKLENSFKGNIVSNIISIFQEYEIQIESSEFSRLIEDEITNNKETGYKFKQQSVIELYKVVSKERQIEIAKAIHFKLNMQFDFDLYYGAIIREVIPLNKRVLFDLIDKLDIEKYKNNNKQKLSWGRFDYALNYINELLNICFKFNIKTNTTRFEKIKSISNYYEWLLDMENFNYTKFDIEWIVAYKTVFFNKRISKSKNTITYILNYLKTKRDRKIADALINIQNYSN